MNRFKIEYLLIVILPVLASWIGSLLPGMQGGSIGPSLLHISLGAALLTGLMALFVRYLAGQWQYLIAVAASLLYAGLSLRVMNAPISILPLFLVNLVYSVLTILILKFVFYIKTIFRFRTILFGVAGALIFSVYLAFLYQLLTIQLPEGFWNATFMYGLIIYVFIGFGMSMADLIILRLDVAELKSQGRQDQDTQEDDS